MAKELKTDMLAITLTVSGGMSDYMWSKASEFVKDILVPKKYLFVREFGETSGKLHFHGFVELHKKMRPSEAKKALLKKWLPFSSDDTVQSCQKVKAVYDMEGWIGYMEHNDIETNMSKEEMDKAKEHYNNYVITKKKFPTNHLVHSPVSAIQIWMEKHPDYKFKTKKDFVAILIAMNKEGYDFSNTNNLGKVYFTLLSRINDDHDYFKFMIEKQIDKELQVLKEF